MARATVSDGSLLPDIVSELAKRSDALVTVVGPNTVEISLIGSYGPTAMQLAVELRVRAWEAAARARGHDVSVHFLGPEARSR